MDKVSSHTHIPPEVQIEVSKFFDAKIAIYQAQEKRLEGLLDRVRNYRLSYTLSKERAIQALSGDTTNIDSQLVLDALPTMVEQGVQSEGKQTEDDTLILPSEEDHQFVNDKDDDIGSPSSDLVYDKSWNHASKIQFVTLTPSRYGYRTFDSSNTILDAILQHEPDWLVRESRKVIYSKIAPTVSKLVKRGSLIKVCSKKSKNDFHFVSSRWFNRIGHIKPEYIELVKDLELPTPEKKLAPARTGANTAKSNTDKIKPSSDAAGTSIGSISPS